MSPRRLGILTSSLFLFGCSVAHSPVTTGTHLTGSSSAQVATTATPAIPLPDSPSDPKSDSEALIQVALLLDTSSSMNGLIEQAKSQLWTLINELGRAQQNGKTPRVQVALYEYGKSGLRADQGFVRKLADFSSDLDSVSEQLFQLGCNGGQEYCGFAIQTATEELQWSTGPRVYKVIFVAGNEAFTQGPVNYRSACEKALSKGILVNTIYCSRGQLSREQQSWKDGAAAGHGRFLTIDHNARQVAVAAPQDERLAELSQKLNESYIPYGGEGGRGQARQIAMDQSNAQLGASVLAERATAKVSASYAQDKWDLVDASRKGKVDLKSVKAEDLPAPMRGLDESGRKAYIDKKTQERSQVQEEIRKLSRERQSYLASQRRSSQTSLDGAILEVARSQASAQGYVFKDRP